MGFPKQLAIGAIFTTAGLFAYDFAKATLKPSNFGMQLSDLGIQGRDGTNLNVGIDVVVDNATSQEVTITDLTTIIFRRRIKTNGSIAWDRLGRTAASDRSFPIKPNDRTKIENVTISLDGLKLVGSLADLIQRIRSGGSFSETLKATTTATVNGVEVTQSKQFSI